MAELVTRGLVFLGLIVAGWLVSKYRSELARKTVRILPIIAGVLVGSLVLTGYLRMMGMPTMGLNAETHRWTGHAIVIFLWLSMPFGGGVLLQKCFRRRTLIAVLQLVVLLIIPAIGLLASITGYLGPTYSPPVSEETHKRFEILHEYFLPGILVALLVEWWWFFRPQTSSSLPSA
jgi:hypothetical protein